ILKATKDTKPLQTIVTRTPKVWIQTWLPIAKSGAPVPPSPGAVNTPVRIAPTMPPSPWTPKTSSESSAPSILFRPLTPQRQTRPPAAPITIPPITPTDPQAGVIATRPAMAPEAAPSMEGLPLKIHSPKVQATVAAAVANSVLIRASAAPLVASRFEPALKPNQPTHSIAAPTSVRGTEWGARTSRP